MKMLVTGAAGFMGCHLVDYLISQNHEVIALDNLSGGLKENVNKKATFVNGDLRNKDLAKKAIKNADIVYHLAAYAPVGLSHFLKHFNYDTNLLGSINLINAAINENIKSFVFTSSMDVYGKNKVPMSEDMSRNPNDSYGIAKAAVERELEICKDVFGMDYVIIRPHNIYGPRQNMSDPMRNVLTIWINRILKNQPPLIYGDGKQERAFSYVDDITPPLAKSGWTKKAYGEIINLGSEDHVTINKACELVLEVMESSLKPEHYPSRPNEVKLAWCTVEKSKQLLGYETKTPLREGIEKLAEWAKKQGPQEVVYRDSYEIEKNMPIVWKKCL